MTATMTDTWTLRLDVNSKPTPRKLNRTKYRTPVDISITIEALNSQPRTKSYRGRLKT